MYKDTNTGRDHWTIPAHHTGFTHQLSLRSINLIEDTDKIYKKFHVGLKFEWGL